MTTTFLRHRAAIATLIGALLISVLAGACNTAPVPAPPTSHDSTAKLLITQPGMAQITAADLRVAGWPESDLPNLRVVHDGQELPTRLTDTALIFYAPISPTRYMSETVFWLRRADQPGTRLSDQPIGSGGDLGLLDRYTATVRLEENRVYSPQVADGDHWLWAQLIAPATKTVTVTLSAVQPGAAQLQIEVWGNTEAPANPDHRYRVAVNGQDAGEVAWDGSGYHTVELAVPDGVLRDGDNVLTLQAPGVADVTVDGTYLNAVTVHYPRAFTAQNDELSFESAGGKVAFNSFSGPIEVFDVTDPEQPVRVPSDGAAFASAAGRRYWAVGPRGYRSGRWQAAQLTPDLRATDQAAAYVAIGPVDLLSPLQPLLDWHTTQGLTTAAIPVEAIYDQFGGGRVDPEAIRAFLQYATQHWTVPPRYALVVGDASYDMLNYTTLPEANRVPTFLVQTVFGGETGSDVPLAQLDGDDQPDIAVGRLPARTPDQVATYVQKALAYEKSAPSGDWASRVLAVADGQEPGFRADAQAFLDRFGQSYEKQLVNPPAGADQASADIVTAWNAGQGVIGYFGHGSVTQWGKDNVFTVKDVPALQNTGKLPLVINMTCLAGLFTHPKVQSLTETLLWQPDSGAVAALAPTSLTLATDQTFLSNALVDELQRDGARRLGDVLLAAQRSVAQAGPGTHDVLQTFLLFGDPALRLAHP